MTNTDRTNEIRARKESFFHGPQGRDDIAYLLARVERGEALREAAIEAIGDCAQLVDWVEELSSGANSFYIEKEREEIRRLQCTVASYDNKNESALNADWYGDSPEWTLG
jgi:hypothetical protein